MPPLYVYCRDAACCVSTILLRSLQCINVKYFTMYIRNQYLRQNTSSLASFHAGCDGNRRVESPEACHRKGTRQRGILGRRFHDRGHGMTWKGEATPHPLPTLCTIRSRKITTAVTVAPKHTGDLKLLPPKLHNEFKSSIERTILALGRINAPTHNQRAAQIGVGIDLTIPTPKHLISSVIPCRLRWQPSRGISRGLP